MMTQTKTLSLEMISNVCEVPVFAVRGWITSGDLKAFKSPVGFSQTAGVVYEHDFSAFLRARNWLPARLEHLVLSGASY